MERVHALWCGVLTAKKLPHGAKKSKIDNCAKNEQEPEALSDSEPDKCELSGGKFSKEKEERKENKWRQRRSCSALHCVTAALACNSRLGEEEETEEGRLRGLSH